MSTADQVTELERRSLAKVKLYLMIYLIVGYFFWMLDRTNIGFAALTMRKDLGMSAQLFGMAAGIFGLSGFVMQVPNGLLLQRFKPKFWLTFSMTLWAVVVMSQAFVHSGIQLIVLRFLLGVFESGYQVGMPVLVSLWFRGKNQGTAMSFLVVGMGLSAVIGGPLAGWMLGQHFFGLTGWRSLFLIEGALTFIWMLCSVRLVYNSPEKTSWLKPDEREFMGKYLAEYQDIKVSRGALNKVSLWGALKDSRIVTLMIVYGLSGWSSGVFSFFMPIMLKRAGAAVSNQYVGYLSMGPWICGIVGAYFLGRHADRTHERHWHSVVPILMCAVGMMLYPIATTPLVAMLALCVVQAGNNMFFVNFWPSCNMVVGKETIAKTTSLISASMLLCSFLGPTFFGWAMDKTGGTTLGLYTCVVSMLLTFVAMNVFWFRYKAQQKRLAPEKVAATVI